MEDISLMTSLKDAVSFGCVDSLESSTFSMLLQQMMEPILTRGSICGSPGDVIAQLSGHRIQLIQSVTLSNKAFWIEALGAGRVPSCNSAEEASIGFVTHRPRCKGRQNPPETSLLLIGPADSIRVFAIADISVRIPLDNLSCLQESRLRVFYQPRLGRQFFDDFQRSLDNAVGQLQVPGCLCSRSRA